jgi:HD-GYP domain-containing protein (c-di-GMP phosphodiesterase class II)
MPVNPVKSSTDLRLAELMAAISLAIDIADGYPLEKSLRDALLAVGLARQLGLDGQDLSDVYYTALLAHLGCTAQSFDLAAGFGGDDIGIRRVQLTGDPKIVRKAFRESAKTMSPLEVAAIMARIAVGGRRLFQSNTDATCEAADRLAARLGMSGGVRRALLHVYTRWDGKGFPQTSGEDIPLPARITGLAFLAVAYDQFGGHASAVAMVKQRAGTGIDPTVARAFLRNADHLLGLVEPESIWDTALAAEPEPRPWLPASRLDQVAHAFADFVDLKSPFTLSHSTGVARIAETAVRLMGRGEDAAVGARLAGLLHDLGRVSVPNGIWDKQGSLTGAEWERVRMHPYYTERILAHSPMLQPLAEVAGLHHERLDGSGYHRGASAASISAAARVLEASDTYQAMTEARPHRPALAPSKAAEQLGHEARTGRLDHEAVQAVLDSVGQARPHERQTWPVGLSEREVDVLRLVARGKREKEIGRALFISTNTVHHHVKQIYEKAGVSTRAGAALFAMEHDLILR